MAKEVNNQVVYAAGKDGWVALHGIPCAGRAFRLIAVTTRKLAGPPVWGRKIDTQGYALILRHTSFLFSPTFWGLVSDPADENHGLPIRFRFRRKVSSLRLLWSTSKPLETDPDSNQVNPRIDADRRKNSYYKIVG